VIAQHVKARGPWISMRPGAQGVNVRFPAPLGLRHGAA